MNWTIYCIECVASVALFTGAIMIPLCRNPVWWIHDYPADIQEKYFENHELLAGAKGFKTAFPASYGLWFVVDWYDCFFLDWVLFANVKSIRLPGTEQMDLSYHQKKYHVIRSLIGMALGLVPCLVCGWIVAAVSQ